MINEIFDFNETVLNLSERTLNPMTHKDGEYSFTVKALNEEIREFEEGFAAQDIVRMVDSALDLCYFAIGSLRRMGLTRAQATACFQAIHTANMTKKRGGLAKRGNFEDDAVKPDGFVPPDEAIGRILFGE